MPQKINTAKLNEERGQTMAELALVLPVLLVLLLGIAQFGVAFNNYISLTDAVRAGARVAAVSRNSPDPAGACRAPSPRLGRKPQYDGARREISRARRLGIPESDVTVHADYPYDISLLNWNVLSGRFDSTMKERVE